MIDILAVLLMTCAVGIYVYVIVRLIRSIRKVSAELARTTAERDRLAEDVTCLAMMASLRNTEELLSIQEEGAKARAKMASPPHVCTSPNCDCEHWQERCDVRVDK